MSDLKEQMNKTWFYEGSALNAIRVSQSCPVLLRIILKPLEEMGRVRNRNNFSLFLSLKKT